MEAIDYYKEDDRGQTSKIEAETKAMQRCAERIWNAISRYVAIEEDGIFKDPDWPHLWDKK